MQQQTVSTAIARLAALVDRLRPEAGASAESMSIRFDAELLRLEQYPEEAARLGDDLLAVLSLPHQNTLYAETGVRSALGFFLELAQRVGQRLLPRVPEPTLLRDVLGMVFRHPRDYEWVNALPEDRWLALCAALNVSSRMAGTVRPNLLEAIRVVSYRLAGAALDRELLRADPALEHFESPFLAQNAALVPLLDEALRGQAPAPIALRELDVFADQCAQTLKRLRSRATENGISIRLTYQLSRLWQLNARLRKLISLAADGNPEEAVHFFKALLGAEQTRHRVGRFIAENISLVARNVTDHASHHGEHYIAESRSEWWAMARAAAGGGLIIALMAMIKIRLALLHLPPLTEGIAFGLNYGLGFVLIHLLGFSVATKQPAMTAASIAATLEEAEETKARDLDGLGDVVRNVTRTQFIAVLGNIGLAFPVACLIAFAWPHLFGAPIAPVEKSLHMLHEIDPLHSAALWFAAIAGVGLFLSGLVSGFFDNQARYHGLAARVAVMPGMKWLGAARLQRLGNQVDAHYGAIIGNLFFGMYLGLVGALGNLTGLPVDIRHVAFSSANVGTAWVTQGTAALADLLPLAIAGVIAIALVNLAVSFGLALYVAMQSRRLGSAHAWRLAVQVTRDFLRHPLSFISPPPRS